MAEKKESYSEEELNEMIVWFNNHADELPKEMQINKAGHYKIFCVNGNTGFRNESRIFYFIHLQNEEAYERKESSSA